MPHHWKSIKYIILIVLFVGLIVLCVHTPFFRCEAYETDETDKTDKTVTMTAAYVITTHTPKGMNRMQSLMRNFARYKLPPVYPHYAKPFEDIDQEKLINEGVFHPNMYEIIGEKNGYVSFNFAWYSVIDQIANGDDEWVYVFEDDARVVNVELGYDLTTFVIPLDADCITWGTGYDVVYGSENHKYIPRRGGGMAHALAISRQGAQKLLLAMTPLTHAFDITLPICGCAWVHEVTEHQTKENLDIADSIHQKFGLELAKKEPCLNIYYSVRLFEQTSNPTPPILVSEESKEMFLKTVAERVGTMTLGYAIDPEDWVVENSSL